MKDDLISRSALLERLAFKRMGSMQRNTYPGLESAIAQVKKAPAVDAVAVVRCKDCAWCKKPFPEHFPQKLECMRFDMEIAADEFCSRSERRDDNDH